MEKNVDPALASTVRRLREARGMTQEELAFAASITVSTLSRIERGLNSPRWSTIGAVAIALDITVAELARTVEAL